MCVAYETWLPIRASFGRGCACAAFVAFGILGVLCFGVGARGAFVRACVEGPVVISRAHVRQCADTTLNRGMQACRLLPLWWRWWLPTWMRTSFSHPSAKSVVLFLDRHQYLTGSEIPHVESRGDWLRFVFGCSRCILEASQIKHFPPRLVPLSPFLVLHVVRGLRRIGGASLGA